MRGSGTEQTRRPARRPTIARLAAPSDELEAPVGGEHLVVSVSAPVRSSGDEPADLAEDREDREHEVPGAAGTG